MARYTVRIQGEITLPPEGTTTTVDEVADRICKEMAALAYNTRAEQRNAGIYDFSMTVSGVTPQDAVLEGSIVLRTAAHAAMVSTGDWPAPEEWEGFLLQRAVEAVELDEFDAAGHTSGHERIPA